MTLEKLAKYLKKTIILEFTDKKKRITEKCKLLLMLGKSPNKNYGKLRKLMRTEKSLSTNIYLQQIAWQIFIFMIKK